MHVYAVLLLTSIFGNTTKIYWAFSPAYPLNRSWSLSTIESRSTLPSRVQIGQGFHSLYSWQQQSPSFECFKDNLKDTGSKQESSGSKICVSSVRCLFAHRCLLAWGKFSNSREDQPLAIRFLLLSPILLSPAWSTSGVNNTKMLWQSTQMNCTLSDTLTTGLYSVVSISQTDGSCKSFLQISSTDIHVELEDVTNGEFLGTILDANLRKLSFQQPTASFQFRPFRSAALRHISFQLPLPENAWPADTLFQINKPDLMYSNW